MRYRYTLREVEALMAIKGQSFQIKFYTKNGELIEVKEAYCSSSHFRTHTSNIVICASSQVRKIRNILIIEFNNTPVIIS